MAASCASCLRSLMPRHSRGSWATTGSSRRASRGTRGQRALAPPALPAENADDIGEVVLALLVLRGHLVERGPERGGVEAVHAGADLLDLALRGGGVAMLHDGGRLPLLADHAAVSGGIVHARGEERGGGAGCGGRAP